MDRELEARLDRIDKKLNAMAAANRKDTWLPPGWVTKLTGWNREELRQARENKIVEYKASPGGGWLYKLESIPEQFIKRKQAS
jgi:hypothetical protein